MDLNELRHWVAFNRISGVGRARYTLLEQSFGSLEVAWSASVSELMAAGIDSKTARHIASTRPNIDPDAEIQKLNEAGARAFTWHDAEYPPRLKEIYDRPPVIYVKGELLPEDERSVAVVGTRRPSPYGREAAHRLAYDIAHAGVTIVSGLAIGIDGIAHRAALDAGHRTIAVLGAGVDINYPQRHAELSARILENGALVSEFPLGTEPA